MKNLTSRLLLTGAALLFAVSVTAAAQDQSTPSNNGQKTVTGCLSGPNDEGAYVLKSSKGTFEVGGNDQLKQHVGHTVRLTGEWVKSGAEIGEN
jgi:hypothetical protein